MNSPGTIDSKETKTGQKAAGGFLIVSGIVLSLCSVLLFVFSYGAILDWILARAGRLDQTEIFKTHWLPFPKFNLIRAGLLTAAIVYWGMFKAFGQQASDGVVRFCSLCLQTAASFARKVRLLLEGLNVYEKIGFGAVCSAVILWRFYLSVHLPINYDEAFTYLQFSSKAFWVPMAYYKAPNNHIFFSLLSHLFVQLPVNPLYAIRFTSLFAGGLSLIMLFLIIKETLSPRVALMALILFSFAYPITLYGVHARGYGLVLFFFLCGTYAMFKILTGGNRRQAWLVFGLSSILGFYTIPIFLYSFATLASFLFLVIAFRKDWGMMKEWFLCISLAVIGTAILYSPVLIFSGSESITSNKFIVTREYEDLISRFFRIFKRIMNWMFGSYPYGYVAPLLMTGICLIRMIFENGKARLMAFYSTYSILMIYVMVLILRVAGYERIWIHLIGVLALQSALVLDLFFVNVRKENFKKILYPLVYFLCFAYAGWGMFSFQASYNNIFFLDRNVGRLADQALASGTRHLYTNLDHFEVLFRFKAAQKKYPFKLDVKKVPEAGVNYDLIIWDKRKGTLPVEFAQSYEEVLQSSLVDMRKLKSELAGND